MRFFPTMQGWFNIWKLVDVIYYIKWGNSNDHFIRSEVGGKTSDKIQHVYKKNC